MAKKPSIGWRTAIVTASLLVLAVMAFSLTALYQRDAMITPENFQRVQIGMTRSQLHALLGPPGRQLLVLGLVKDARTITTNFGGDQKRLRERGYKDYVLDSWCSQVISIAVFVDENDKVVCCYPSGGQDQTLLGRVWPRKRVTLASMTTSSPE